MKGKLLADEVFKRLHERAEQILKDKGKKSAEDLDDDLMRLTHELEVYYVEMELQNEELKRSEAEAETLKEEYFDLFNTSPVAYVILDKRSIIERANEAAHYMLGGGAYLQGQSFSLCVHIDDVDKYISFMKTLHTNRIAGPIELRLRGTDAPVHVHVQGVIKVDENGLMHLRLALMDISDRKRAEEALRDSEDRLRIAVQGGKLGTWDRSFIPDHVTWNSYLYEMRGRNPEGPPITGDTFFEYIHPDDRDRVLKHLEVCLKDGDEFQDEFRVVRDDGEIRWMGSVGRLYRDGKGDPMRMAGINNDITEQKRIEEELRKARNELERRVKERTAELERRAGQLARLSSGLTLAEQKERSRIAKILHDHLQQLLVGAKIKQEVLLNKIGDTEKATAERVLDLINRSIKEMRSLNAELAPPVLNSGDLSSSVEWLSRWMKENQSFEVKVEFETPIVLDRKNLAVLLFQSIRELLLNVLKHAGVKSASVKMDRQDGNLHVVISDQGVGFNPERVWKQADSEQKFGLISIRERLQHLGGRFEVESSPNAGSAISLIVPMKEEKSSKTSEGYLGSVIPRTSPARLTNERIAGKIRIMLVDDHPAMREGLSGMLNTHSDLEIVAEASDGQEAVHLSRELLPDVILMDISMPKMGGVEATRIISSEFPHIRIIGLSMFSEDDLAKDIINAGATAYRIKGTNTDRLLAEIRGEEQ